MALLTSPNPTQGLPLPPERKRSVECGMQSRVRVCFAGNSSRTPLRAPFRDARSGNVLIPFFRVTLGGCLCRSGRAVRLHIRASDPCKRRCFSTGATAACVSVFFDLFFSGGEGRVASRVGFGLSRLVETVSSDQHLALAERSSQPATFLPTPRLTGCQFNSLPLS